MKSVHTSPWQAQATAWPQAALDSALFLKGCAGERNGFAGIFALGELDNQRVGGKLDRIQNVVFWEISNDNEDNQPYVKPDFQSLRA